ncbi:MAG: hypothetical protein PHG53_09520 [Phycisphaerae bacterium]|nr:hypothetical protein [Phycisphaerae bacterium]
MAELGLDSRYNLVSSLKLVKDNKLVNFAEICTEKNPFMQDIPIVPANGAMSNEGSRETSLPTPQIIKIGDGHNSSTVKWDNFTENISLFVDRASIPKHVLDIMPDKTGYRSKIENRHIEGFSQGVCNHFFYGTSAATPEKFDGLDVRYKTPDNSSGTYDPTNPDPSTAANFGVFDAAGTGTATTSIWMIQPSVDKFCGITPANDPKMGISQEDSGLVYATAENSLQRQEWRTEFEWKIGLNISDIRSVARIRNIAAAIASIDESIIKLIYQARNEIFKGSEPVFMYIPKRLLTHFQVLGEAKQNVIYDRNNIYDVPLYRFGDMVIRAMDALSISETAVTAV